MGNTTDKSPERSAVEMLSDALSNINKRRAELLRELAELDTSLKAYGIDPSRVTGNQAGKDHTAAAGDDGHLAATPADSGPSAIPAKTRRRRQPPPVEWVVEQLEQGKCSQPDLARRASSAGFSDTAVVAMLKKHDGRFKWERAPRQISQRGIAPVIWSLRG